MCLRRGTLRRPSKEVESESEDIEREEMRRSLEINGR